MASSLEEQSQDLSTCCICTNCYNEEEHKPKFLINCHHTFCLKCIQTILAEAGMYRFACPVCKKVCIVPEGAAESLSTNIYALHIAKLKSDSIKEQNWCLECDMIVKPNCLQLKHKSVSLMQEVEGIEGQLIDICTQLKESVGRREKVNEHLAQKKEKLEAKLKAIQVEMVNNSNCLEKLHLMIANCQELSKMSPSIKTSKVVRKKIKRTWQEAQDEAKQSEELLNLITSEDKEPCAKKPCTKRSVASNQLLNPVPGSSSQSLPASTIQGNPTLIPSVPSVKVNPRKVQKVQTSSAPNQVPPMTAQKATGQILLKITSATGVVSIDVTQAVYQAVQKGLVVSHEPRSLTLDLGIHGRALLMAQIDSNGPRVLSAISLPSLPQQLIAID